MPDQAKTRRMNGGHAVVDCLRNEGVRHVFNVPGESFTSILDGMLEAQQIQLISNRQEGGACLMAEAYAKASRAPGVSVRGMIASAKLPKTSSSRAVRKPLDFASAWQPESTAVSTPGVRAAPIPVESCFTKLRRSIGSFFIDQIQ